VYYKIQSTDSFSLDYTPSSLNISNFFVCVNLL
jgi:hypothetical protein